MKDASGWIAKERAWRAVFDVEGYGQIALDGVFHTGDARWIVRGISGEGIVYFEVGAFEGLDCAFHLGYVSGELAARTVQNQRDRARRAARHGRSPRRRGRPRDPKIQDQVAQVKSEGLTDKEAAQRFGGKPETWRVRLSRHRRSARTPADGSGVT